MKSRPNTYAKVRLVRRNKGGINLLTYNVSVASHLTNEASPRSQQGVCITYNSRWISLAPMKCSICEDRVICLGVEVRREWILNVEHLALHAVRYSSLPLRNVTKGVGYNL